MDYEERIARYHAWLDRAESFVERAISVDPDVESADLRTVAAAVNLLRTIISVRQKLGDGLDDDFPADEPTEELTDEKYYALLAKYSAFQGGGEGSEEEMP